MIYEDGDAAPQTELKIYLLLFYSLAINMALRLSSHSLLHGRVRSLKISGKYNWTVLIGFVAMESFHLKVSLDLWLLEKNATFDIFTILQIRGRESLLRWSSSKAKVQPRPRGSCGDFFLRNNCIHTFLSTLCWQLGSLEGDLGTRWI